MRNEKAYRVPFVEDGHVLHDQVGAQGLGKAGLHGVASRLEVVGQVVEPGKPEVGHLNHFVRNVEINVGHQGRIEGVLDELGVVAENGGDGGLELIKVLFEGSLVGSQRHGDLLEGRFEAIFETGVGRLVANGAGDELGHGDLALELHSTEVAEAIDVGPEG